MGKVLIVVKKWLKTVASVLAIALLLVACNDDKEESTESENTAPEITEEEKLPEDEIVAVVNGDEINGKTYNIVYSQLKLQAAQFNDEVDLDEIKELTIESVIDRQLLIQEAKEIGIEYTDEEIEEQFLEMKENNGEALETILGQYQFTEEMFKEQIKFEFIMNDFMNEAIEISVDDDELKEHYEKAKEDNDDIPPFDEIKNDLQRRLVQQKTTEQLEKLIEEAKEVAKIEQKLS